MSVEVLTPGYAEHEALTTAHEIAAGFLRVARDIQYREFTPDLHQERAIEEIGRALVSGEHEGHLKMATGSGKSLLISMLTEAATLAEKRVLILAPRVAICDQLIGENGQQGLGKFSHLVADEKVSKKYSGHISDSTKPVVVSTYAGFLNEYKSGNGNLGEFDLIIGDECHRSLGPTTSKAMKDYMPGAVKLGFSATPDFADDRKSEEVFGKLLFDYPLRTAIEDGTSAPVRALLLETGHSVKLTDNQKDFTERELAPLARMDTRNAAAAQLVADFVGSGRQGIISCIPGGGNAHARLMAELLSSQSIDKRTIIASDIGSHLDADEIHKRLQAFKAGEIDVLTFTRTLEEGWDDPAASFCINLCPTTSPLKTTQLLGRILRKNPNGQESIFIDFIDQTTGVKKQQYTALHALDIDLNDISHVIGSSTGSGSGMNIQDIGDILSNSLLNQLLKSNGKTLREIFIQEVTRDPLFAQWERTLTKEGLPKRLDAQYTPDKKLYEYEAIINTLAKELGRLPVHAEFMQEVDYLGSADKLKMAEFTALQLYAASRLLGGTVEELGVDDPELDRRFDHEALQQELQRAFASRVLSSKGAQIMLQHLSTPWHERKSQAQFREAYGLSAKETSQLFKDGPDKLAGVIRFVRSAELAGEHAPARGKPDTTKQPADIVHELVKAVGKRSEVNFKYLAQTYRDDSRQLDWRYKNDYISNERYWLNSVAMPNIDKAVTKALDVQTIIEQGLVEPVGYYVHGNRKLIRGSADVAEYYTQAQRDLTEAVGNMRAIVKRQPKMNLQTAINSRLHTIRLHDINLLFNIDDEVAELVSGEYKSQFLFTEQYKAFAKMTISEALDRGANTSDQYKTLAIPTTPFALRNDRPPIYDWNQAIRVRSQLVLKALNARISKDSVKLDGELAQHDATRPLTWPMATVRRQSDVSFLQALRLKVYEAYVDTPKNKFRPLDLTGTEYQALRATIDLRPRYGRGFRHS